MRRYLIITLVATLALIQFFGCGKLLKRDEAKETPFTTDAPPVKGDITGTYIGKGENPGGAGSYDCTVEISKSGEGYLVAWYFDGKLGYEGTGILKDDTLAVGFANPNGYGVVAYTVNPDGSLDGTWAGAGDFKTGTETLKRK
jgi:hypothetical protein